MVEKSSTAPIRPCAHHLFHRAAASTDSVEDDGLIAGVLAGPRPRVIAPCVVMPTVVMATSGFAAESRKLDLRHAASRAGGVGEYASHEGVEPHDVGHREHHGDVLRADPGRNVP